MLHFFVSVHSVKLSLKPADKQIVLHRDTQVRCGGRVGERKRCVCVCVCVCV